MKASDGCLDEVECIFEDQVWQRSEVWLRKIKLTFLAVGPWVTWVRNRLDGWSESTRAGGEPPGG